MSSLYYRKAKIIYSLICEVVYLTCHCMRLGAHRISRLLNKHSNKQQKQDRSYFCWYTDDLKSQLHLTVRLLIIDLITLGFPLSSLILNNKARAVFSSLQFCCCLRRIVLNTNMLVNFAIMHIATWSRKRRQFNSALMCFRTVDSDRYPTREKAYLRCMYYNHIQFQ